MIGKYLEKKGVFYKPIIRDDYKGYLSWRDDTVGWPSRNEFGKDGQRDHMGARMSPQFPDPDTHRSCVSLYGNSFAWAAEVDHEHAWANILSGLINCRTANFGVGGYGTDQAYVRFLHNNNDTSKVVILTHLSENILRNVNQYTQFLYPGTYFGFKPRFILSDNNDLQLIPLPNFSEAQYPDIVEHPEKYLKHDYFLPHGPSGTLVLHFPYTWAIMKSLSNFHVYPKLMGKSWYSDFYLPDHPSEALEITTEIMKSFTKEISKQGKSPVIILFAGHFDLSLYQKKNVWSYQGLMDNLNKEGIEFLNAGDGIIKYLNTRDPIEIFVQRHGHYNNEGNKILAQIVYEYLTEKKVLKSASED